jgi:hypothetical protein
MYEVEVAYRPLSGGAVEFIPEAETAEDHQDFCVLKVRFHVAAIYPPEPDVGAGLDWDGDIDTIHMRIAEFPRSKRLRDEAFVTAKTFLLREHGKALWQAGDDFAESLHFGEVA